MIAENNPPYIHTYHYSITYIHYSINSTYTYIHTYGNISTTSKKRPRYIVRYNNEILVILLLLLSFICTHDINNKYMYYTVLGTNAASIVWAEQTTYLYVYTYFIQYGTLPNTTIYHGYMGSLDLNQNKWQYNKPEHLLFQWKKSCSGAIRTHTTYCLRGRCSTNWATEVRSSAGWAESRQYKARATSLA